MDRRKRKYLFTAEPLPRRTACNNRLRARAEAARAVLESTSSDDDENRDSRSVSSPSLRSDESSLSDHQPVENDDSSNHAGEMSVDEADEANEQLNPEVLWGENPNQFERQRLSNSLCPCTTTTEGDALLMCLALGVRHNLSWLAMVDILKMINNCYRAEVVSASKYFLMKYMEVGKDETKFHLYCPSCEKYLGEKDSPDNVNNCDCCEEANRNFIPNFYLSVNVEAQLQQILHNIDLQKEIKTHRFDRKKDSPEAYEDIYDGAAYKSLSKPGGVLFNPLNFSYTINTDGVSVAKSSAMSVWPIFLEINELSPQSRKKNLVLAGMWVGKKDPNMRLFLKTFVKQANRLSTVGMQWANEEGVNVVSKVIPTCIITDSGARYKLLNLSSFHSYWGCTFCYQKAVNTNKGRRFEVPQTAAPLRTEESMLTDMRRAFGNRHLPKNQQVVRGTKGPSPLISMKYFNLSNSFVVDYMHSALLGNTRSHLSHLLNSFRTPYYIGSPQKLLQISERLLMICPPHIISRTPREISEVKFWKASEFRSFLLFYCIVCFMDILPEKFLSHLAVLSSAFYTLLQKSCTPAQLNSAHDLLLKYVVLTEKYFGVEKMLYNVHLLQHLVKSVIDWGPIHCHSTFDFEAENHHLMQMHTSPGHVAHQLTRRYLTYNALPSLCERYASSDCTIQFIENLTGKNFRNFIRCGDTILPGKGHQYVITEEESDALVAAKVEVRGEILCFTKLFYNGRWHATQAYSVGKRHNDSYVSLKCDTKGIVQSILRVPNFNGFELILMIRTLVLEQPPVFERSVVTISHIQRVSHEGGLRARRPNDIKSQCLYMELDNGKFIADVPFGCHGD